MIGSIDSSGRALLTLLIRTAESGEPQELVVWVDTAFDGELVVPHVQIKSLGLQQSAGCQAILADGTTVKLATYYCWVDWFGTSRQVEVIGSDARLPLLGIGLLQSHKLTVDYPSGEVILE